MLRRSLWYLLVSVAALACQDVTSPSSLLGACRLESVSGQSLPYVLEQNATRTEELTGETLTQLAEGRQTMVTYFRVTEGGVSGRRRCRRRGRMS